MCPAGPYKGIWDRLAELSLSEHTAPFEQRLPVRFGCAVQCFQHKQSTTVVFLQNAPEGRKGL